MYKIKPLKWVKCYGNWHARTSVGHYSIAKEGSRWLLFYYFEWQGHIDCESLSDAKQKAQVNWNGKLETCLEEVS